jgi:MFS family permease
VSSSQPFNKHNNFYSRILRGLRLYLIKLRLFKPNARLYLLNTIINGVVYGIFRLLFNFYALSLGYDEVIIGQLLTVSSLVALIGALPAGYLSDRIGRKPSLLLSNFTISLAVMGMVFWRSPLGFYLMNAVIGLSQSLMGVTMSRPLRGSLVTGSVVGYRHGLVAQSASLRPVPQPTAGRWRLSPEHPF